MEPANPGALEEQSLKQMVVACMYPLGKGPAYSGPIR